MKANEWEQCLDIFKWMEIEKVQRSKLSYKTLLHVLDANNRTQEMMNIYTLALREGYFSPWLEGTRKLDVRSFSTPIAKVALKTVLNMMKGALSLVFSFFYLNAFSLSIFSNFLSIPSWQIGHLQPRNCV